MHTFFTAVACATLVCSVAANRESSGQSTGGKAATPADTDKALKAKRVSTRIVVHLDVDGKEIRYALDDEKNSIGHKAAGALFSTSTDLLVTYPRMNPLVVQATANVSETDDPTHAAIAQLIAAIAGVPGLVNPDLAKVSAAAAPRAAGASDPAGFALPKCEELIEAERVLGEIQAGLFGPTVSAVKLAAQFKEWIDVFEGQIGPAGGPKAAYATADRVNSFYDTVHAQADRAAAAIKLAQDRGDDAPRSTAALREYSETLARMLTGKSRSEQIKELANRNEELAALSAAANASASCAQDALNLYRLITIANPQVRLADVRKLEKALAALRDVLRKTYGKGDSWYNDVEYVIAKDITVQPGKLARVVVKVATIKVEAADATLKMAQEDAATASFDIREYTTWVPELGIGATFAVLERPQYGTATNAEGKTVVSKAKTGSFGVSPTVMVNFVPVGLGGSVPIIQLGASTSTSAPAIFVGPGWRVPGTSGKSGVVVGVGGVLGWVKDLDSLVAEQSVVTGTKEIENDLKFHPKPKLGFYVNIQYKF